jgi:hypothetical protein
LYLFCLRQKRIPLLSLALLKNGLPAIFELWVLLRKTQGIVDAGIHAGRFWFLRGSASLPTGFGFAILEEKPACLLYPGAGGLRASPG